MPKVLGAWPRRVCGAHRRVLCFNFAGWYSSRHDFNCVPDVVTTSPKKNRPPKWPCARRDSPGGGAPSRHFQYEMRFRRCKSPQKIARERASTEPARLRLATSRRHGSAASHRAIAVATGCHTALSRAVALPASPSPLQSEMRSRSQSEMALRDATMHQCAKPVAVHSALCTY